MGQFREKAIEVIIPARVLTVNGSVRVWDAPTGFPIHKSTVLVNSGSTYLDTGLTPAAAAIASAAAIANLTHEVFYGGRWDGVPFDASSTHSGGVSQASAGTFTVGTEIAEIVHEDLSILPTNRVGPTVQHDMRKYGFPIVLELTNSNLFAVTLYVTFMCESLATNA